MEKLDFRQFMEIGGATQAIYNPSVKRSRDWNWEGSPGTAGVTPKENPIKNWLPKRKRKKK